MIEYVGPQFHPLSLGDYDAITKHRRAMAIERRNQPEKNSDFKSPYLNQEVGQRVIQWLSMVEYNPELYYGFETDTPVAE